MKDLLKKIINQEQFNVPKEIKEFEIKFYENSDFQALMELYRRVFPGFMSGKLWFWKNINNPCGQFITVLLKDGDRIVAAYSVAPRSFCVNGKPYYCVQSMDTMTDEAYRGLGISTYLARIVYECARLKGASFVYGFPNKNSWYLFEKKLKWRNFGKITLYHKDLSFEPKKKNTDSSTYQIVPILNFSKKFIDFWECSKKKYSIIIEKDLAYLKWRFQEHPFVNYKNYIITEKKTEIIVACFMLKHYQNDTGSKNGHIVDYMIGTKELKLKLDIFRLIDSYSSVIFQKECVSISFWSFDDEIESLALKELGYQAIKTETHFGYKLFSTDEELQLLNNERNWHITMSDNDVF